MIDTIIKELNRKLKKTVEGYKSMSVYDIDLEEIVFSESLDFTFDVDMISMCNFEVVKLKWNIIESAMEINDSVSDIIINLKKEVHIIDITENKNFFIYVAINGENVDTSYVKEILNVYKVKLNNAYSKMLAY